VCTVFKQNFHNRVIGMSKANKIKESLLRSNGEKGFFFGTHETLHENMYPFSVDFGPIF